MRDLRGVEPFDTTKKQIVILRALIPLSKASQIVNQRLINRSEVAYIILTKQQLRIKVGLKVGVIAMTSLINLVLIRVDEAGIRFLKYAVGKSEESLRAQFIIVVQERNPITFSNFECTVRSCRNMTIIVSVHNSDSVVQSLVFVENQPNV